MFPEKRTVPRINDFMLIMIGFLFMLNPMIAYIDIIPDLFGCGLIIYALRRLSSVSPELEEAVNYFKYMLFASLGRIIILFANPGYDDTIKLTFSLIFAVIEFGIMMMAFPLLYDGLAYLNVRYEGNAQEVPEFKVAGSLFFAIRGFFSLVPHLQSIMTDNSGDILSSTETVMENHSGILMLVNIVITLIFAIFFISITFSYLLKFAKDKEYLLRVYTAYNEKNRKEPEFFIRRDLVLVSAILCYGAFFTIDFLGDGKNYLPDLLFSCAVIWAAYVLRKYLHNVRPVIICAAIHAVFSAINFSVYNKFMEKRFFARFDMVLTTFVNEYYVALIFSAAETVALIVLALQLKKLIVPVITEHTVQTIPKEFVRTAKNNEKELRFSLKLTTVYVIALIVTAISGTGLTALLLPFPEYWMIHALICVIFAVISLNLTSRIKNGVLRKYERPSDI